MHSKPLAPRPSGAAHPTASHPAGPDPASSRGSAAGAAPAPARHDRGALAVLVLSLLLVIVTPLPELVPAALASTLMTDFLLGQSLALVTMMLTFVLWAAVIRWLGRHRHGEGAGLAPLLALGVILLMSLIDPARTTVSMLADVFAANESMSAVHRMLRIASIIATVLAALVLAGLALLTLLRARPLQREVRVPLAPVTLSAVLVAVLVLLTAARPLLFLALETAAVRSALPLLPFHVPQIVYGLLTSAALVVVALLIARTEGRLRRLAWAVPILLWIGALVSGVAFAVQTMVLIASEQHHGLAASLGPALGLVVDLLTGAAATVVAVILLVLSVRARSSPDASVQA